MYQKQKNKIHPISQISLLLWLHPCRRQSVSWKEITVIEIGNFLPNVPSESWMHSHLLHRGDTFSDLTCDWITSCGSYENGLHTFFTVGECYWARTSRCCRCDIRGNATVPTVSRLFFPSSSFQAAKKHSEPLWQTSLIDF